MLCCYAEGHWTATSTRSSFLSCGRETLAGHRAATFGSYQKARVQIATAKAHTYDEKKTFYTTTTAVSNPRVFRRCNATFIILRGDDDPFRKPPPTAAACRNTPTRKTSLRRKSLSVSFGLVAAVTCVHVDACSKGLPFLVLKGPLSVSEVEVLRHSRSAHISQADARSSPVDPTERASHKDQHQSRAEMGYLQKPANGASTLKLNVQVLPNGWDEASCSTRLAVLASFTLTVVSAPQFAAGGRKGHKSRFRYAMQNYRIVATCTHALPPPDD
ncbi:hypothetical protein BC835DRAFT_368624 [Cytidiella melzeri]|nr:hypothetical protein BC835DRAFT_368624 [Cytidiella melzeri]